MKTKSKYQFKSLLNEDSYHSVAAISIDLKHESWEKGESVDGQINISDCSKVIHLDLDCNNESDKVNALHKLNTLITGLTGAKKWLEKQNPNYEIE